MNHPKENDGYKIARRTGPNRSWVTVYDAKQAGMGNDPDLPMVVVCEVHGTHIGVVTRTAGETVMRAGSVKFCYGCRDTVTEQGLEDLAPQLSFSDDEKLVRRLSFSDDDDEVSLGEMAGRWRKIAMMIAALYKHGIPSDSAVRLDRSELCQVAEVAGVNDPSDKTIELLRMTLQKIPQPQ